MFSYWAKILFGKWWKIVHYEHFRLLPQGFQSAAKVLNNMFPCIAHFSVPNRNLKKIEYHWKWWIPPAGAWQYTYVWEIQGAITHLKIIPVQHTDNMHN